MLLVLVAAGGWRIGVIVHRAWGTYPVAATGAMVLFGLYAVPFVLFLRAVDYIERKPLLMQAAAVAWGGMVATSAAISGSAAMQNVLAKLASPQFAATWGPAVVGAGVEEILKALGVVTLVLATRIRVTSMVDGFVYGALVGLGFQVVENIVFAVNAVAVDSGTDRLTPVVATFLMRGFLSGLWSHTLFTALAGAGVAYALVQRHRSRLVRGGVGVGLFGLAWFFHFLWNSPLLVGGLGYGVLGVVGVMLLKGLPALAVGLTLLAVAERREADYYTALLARLSDHRVATSAEIRALVSPARRLSARHVARRRLGGPGVRALRQLQRAQARLVLAVGLGPPAEVRHRRCEVIACRHRLAALSLAAVLAGRDRGGRTSWLTTAARVVAQVVAVGLLVIGMGIAIRALDGV